MNPRYNIIKFSDSYRNSKQQHTILLPVLMVSVILAAFFVVAKSRPTNKRTSIYNYHDAKDAISTTFAARAADEKLVTPEKGSERVKIKAPPELDLDFISPNLPSIESVDQKLFAESDPIDGRSEIGSSSVSPLIIPKARVIEPELLESSVNAKVEAIGNQPSPEPVAPSESLNLNRFTPWMTKMEMNELIVRLNEGHRDSFWQRGHWITAVEGLWNGTEPEYRIIYEKSPQDRQIYWRYRIDKPKQEFTEIMVQMGREGYELVQSQYFEMPDGSLRYQGVWQKAL